MKNKQIVDFVVQRNYALSHDFTRLLLQADCKLPEIVPGQFVQVQIPSSLYGWLRIPLSIHYADVSKSQIGLLVQKVGDGSRFIAGLKEGEKVNLVLPLGNGFSLPEKENSVSEKPLRVLLAGGGCGLAPLYFLGMKLKEKDIPFTFLVGAKNKERLVLTQELEKLADTGICTEDGSEGVKGLITAHPLWEQTDFSHVYTCGPTPMMKAVAQLAQKRGACCQVSLENKMACGLGTCLCCVTPTAGGHNTCVCTDGPVFDSRTLDWQ
ncbi:MAG: dihydroorotate dehydrogenase electron transfer subunit [Lentimicrobiaceae bacterium]|nr:dihydroorotate dehydrogenase electron transfer subunit [Lentimicrobiaceae bacterium]